MKTMFLFGVDFLTLIRSQPRGILMANPVQIRQACTEPLVLLTSFVRSLGMLMSRRFKQRRKLPSSSRDTRDHVT